MSTLRDRLQISPDRLEAINQVLLNPETGVVNRFLEVVEKYGTPEEINRQAREARQLENLLQKVQGNSARSPPGPGMAAGKSSPGSVPQRLGLQEEGVGRQSGGD